MPANATHRLTADVFSAFNAKEATAKQPALRRQYGRRGEQVQMIRYADDVCIVEGAAGRYPVRTEKLEPV